MKIPPGTQSGRVFRLKGKGFPDLHSYRKGDEHVIIKVVTPTNLTERQKELLREFEALSGEKNAPSVKGFFEKVKNLFG